MQHSSATHTQSDSDAPATEPTAQPQQQDQQQFVQPHQPPQQLAIQPRLHSLPPPPYFQSPQPPSGAYSSHPPPPQPVGLSFPQPFIGHPRAFPLPQHHPPAAHPPSAEYHFASSHSFPSPPPPFHPAAGEIPPPLLAHIQQLQQLTQQLSPEQLALLGIDQQTIATLTVLSSSPSVPHLPPSNTATAPSPSSSTSSSPSPPPASTMSYKTDYTKRHRDSDSTLKRTKLESHATTPSSTSDTFSPSPRRTRRHLDNRSGDDDDRGSDTGSDNDSDGSNGSETADDNSPMLSSSNKKRSEEDKVRNELQRKRQHQKSDKQRRAKIKDGMEQLKALVSLHGKLESPDQASIVSASVDLVHSLRQEISGLKAEVERSRGENAALKQRGLGGYGGLDAVMRGQLGALGQSPLGQLQLSQLSSLQALNSQLSSLNQQQQQQQQQQQANGGGVSQQQLSGLNTLNNINMLSSLGLPTNINATQYQPSANHQHPHHAQAQHQGIHSPLPMMPMQSPPPLSMPASHGSNGFTSQFLTHSPPATGMMYGKEWQ